ncbi:MAG: hypothetical protein VYA51_04435 [Planctomycetota bacterium]|nr:hypothetical protein [Planctomycetota bacterium]
MLTVLRTSLVLVALFATCTGGLRAQGKVFLEPAEALELAFPKCKFERKTHVLSKQMQAEIKKRSGLTPPRSVMYVYQASKDGKVVGHAYFDRHRVRSKKELIMVAVDKDARASRIEVVAFEEPVDYMPRGIWYEQFKERALNKDLSVKTGVIKPVAGCTLTVHATVDTVRRLLASHQLIYPSKRAVPVRPSKGRPSTGPSPARPPSRAGADASQGLR